MIISPMYHHSSVLQFGHDHIYSLLDGPKERSKKLSIQLDLIHDKAEKRPALSFLFGGSGDCKSHFHWYINHPWLFSINQVVMFLGRWLTLVKKLGRIYHAERRFLMYILHSWTSTLPLWHALWSSLNSFAGSQPPKKQINGWSCRRRSSMYTPRW